MSDQRTPFFHSGFCSSLPAEHTQQFENRPPSLDFVDAFFSRQWCRLFSGREISGQSAFRRELENMEREWKSASYRDLKTALNEIDIAERPVQLFMILRCIANQCFEHTAGIDVTGVELWRAYMMYTGHAINSDTDRGLESGFAAAGLALSGRPVHLVYADSESLARARKRLQPFFQALDLITGCVDDETPQAQRRSEYQADICFCLARELVFDYLRDRLRLGDMSQPLRLQAEALYREKPRARMLALRGLHVALIADIDKLLVDAARAPLEISASGEQEQTENRTMARLSYPGFFRRYGQLGGYGRLSGLESELWAVYRLGVVKIQEKQELSLAERCDYRFYKNDNDKWQAILSEVQRCYAAKRPVFLSVETKTAAEQIQSMLKQAGLPCLIHKQDGVSQQNRSPEYTPVILFQNDMNIHLPETGSLIRVEYHSPRRRQRMRVNSGARTAGLTTLVFISPDDKLLATIIAGSLRLRLIAGLLRHGAGCNSRVGNYLLSRFVSLVDKTGERMQAKARHRLLRQEIQKGKMLSFAGRGE